MKNNTFFHIRQIVLCDHFRDIGCTDCMIGMKEKVREIKKKKKKKKSHENREALNFSMNDMNA